MHLTGVDHRVIHIRRGTCGHGRVAEDGIHGKTNAWNTCPNGHINTDIQISADRSGIKRPHVMGDTIEVVHQFGCVGKRLRKDNTALTTHVQSNLKIRVSGYITGDHGIHIAYQQVLLCSLQCTGRDVEIDVSIVDFGRSGTIRWVPPSQHTNTENVAVELTTIHKSVVVKGSRHIKVGVHRSRIRCRWIGRVGVHER